MSQAFDRAMTLDEIFGVDPDVSLMYEMLEQFEGIAKYTESLFHRYLSFRDEASRADYHRMSRVENDLFTKINEILLDRNKRKRILFVQTNYSKGYYEPVGFHVLNGGTLRLWLKNSVLYRQISEDYAVDRIRRRIALMREAIVDRCRSSISRCLAVLLLQALLDLVATLTAEAFDQVRPQLTTRVLAAGGGPGLFVIRC